MRTNKAIGTIAGFKSTLFDADDCLKNKWLVHSMIITIDEYTIECGFVYGNIRYTLKGTKIKDDHFETLIYCDKVKCGTFSVTIYSNMSGCMLFGDWHEHDVHYEVWGLFKWLDGGSLNYSLVE